MTTSKKRTGTLLAFFPKVEGAAPPPKKIKTMGLNPDPDNDYDSVCGDEALPPLSKAPKALPPPAPPAPKGLAPPEESDPVAMDEVELLSSDPSECGDDDGDDDAKEEEEAEAESPPPSVVKVANRPASVCASEGSSVTTARVGAAAAAAAAAIDVTAASTTPTERPVPEAILEEDPDESEVMDPYVSPLDCLAPEHPSLLCFSATLEFARPANVEPEEAQGLLPPVVLERQVLSGAQLHSVALAVRAFARQRAFLLGDGTGVGKVGTGCSGSSSSRA